MATYAIGDVQGCAATLQRLLDVLPLDLARDRVWFTGDLVNRGPASLQALRTVRSLGDRAVVVLGNHDLHLLARAAGVSAPKRRDTLDDVLRAEDRDELLAWVRSRPLLHRGAHEVLVHAGIPPRWTVPEAEERARTAELALRGPAWKEFLSDWAHAGVRPSPPPAATAWLLTSLRVVSRDGTPDPSFKGAPAAAPHGTFPWFRAPERRANGVTIVFGHWAALGFLSRPGLLGLDTGCVWGGRLTAVRLEDRRAWSVGLEDR
jgi:bis(5'-nucleosyl)-tetraphosphatase (symmetrical)